MLLYPALQGIFARSDTNNSTTGCEVNTVVQFRLSAKSGMALPRFVKHRFPVSLPEALTAIRSKGEDADHTLASPSVPTPFSTDSFHIRPVQRHLLHTPIGTNRD